jgi:hypothetical protein
MILTDEQSQQFRQSEFGVERSISERGNRKNLIKFMAMRLNT